MTLRLPYGFARQHHLLVTGEDDDAVRVAVTAATAPAALAELRRHADRPLVPELVSADELARRLAERYAQSDVTARDVADDIGQDEDIARLVQDIPVIADLLEHDDDAPIIRMINALLVQAVRENASDIHLESFEQGSVVRFRHDGMLRDIVAPPRGLHAALVSRIKIMASLDIAEKRLPQDGRISIRLAGRPVDIRVSTLPTSHGERVVLRLLDKSGARLDLAALGMAPTTLERMRALVAHPHGIVLVTGPTGSGKTTTLYAALGELDTRVRNVMTVEDPVEYDLEGIGQTQVNPRIDLDFARALRSILRQDPDIIMIGEIRDLETAQIAVQASLTGHLVLATLHTNDAASAVTRLVDMGVEPFLLASSLIGVQAQRLVRRLCPHCKVAYPPDAGEAAQFAGAAPAQLYRPAGCNTCNGTGYLGRTGIFELLEFDDALRSAIHERASAQALAEQAAARGRLVTLREDGLRWVADGTTALEELLRVARD